MALKIKIFNSDLHDLYVESMDNWNSDTEHENAGFDLFIAEDQIIGAKTFNNTIKLGIALDLGEHFMITPRSSVAKKTKLVIPNSPAIIDRGYRGEIMIISHNLGEDELHLKKGDRLFQVIRGNLDSIYKVEIVEELSQTQRGAGSFGSTGGWGQRSSPEVSSAPQTPRGGTDVPKVFSSSP